MISSFLKLSQYNYEYSNKDTCLLRFQNSNEAENIANRVLYDILNLNIIC